MTEHEKQEMLLKMLYGAKLISYDLKNEPSYEFSSFHVVLGEMIQIMEESV